jgi:hypothetical protein
LPDKSRPFQPLNCPLRGRECNSSLPAVRLVLMNGFAPRSSTTRKGLLLVSPETFLCYFHNLSQSKIAKFLIGAAKIANIVRLIMMGMQDNLDSVAAVRWSRQKSVEPHKSATFGNTHAAFTE